MTDLPEPPPETVAEWQRVVDLIARLAQVPASLVMRTDWTEFPKHTVFVSSRTEGNPYDVGREYELTESLYGYGVFGNDGGLVVEDATRDPVWAENDDLDDGMSFYIGYPLKWPDGEPFGTICILDRKRNEHALLFRERLQAFVGVIELNLRSLVELAERARELADANTALKVLLATAEAAQREYGERILQQIYTLVIPHVEKLSRLIGADGVEREYLDLVEANLGTLTSSLSSRLTLEFQKLTAAEFEIAQLVMRGKSTKDIAVTLSRSTSTIDFHRNNIRAKLGLSRNQNLRAYLHSGR